MVSSTPYHSRFKHYLVSPWDRQQELQRIHEFFLKKDDFKTKHSLWPGEEVTLFVFFFLQLRRPGDWKMTSGKKIKSQDMGAVSQGLLFEAFDFLQELESRTLAEAVVHYRPKHLPSTIFDLLAKWMAQACELQLWSRVPTPLEMLEKQAQGQRIVTLSQEAALRGETVDGQRDAFEFLLHDLVHAELFFRDSQSFQEQKQFFEQLQLKIERWRLLEMADEKFLKDLHYLMSDMNSCRAHLQAHFEAILIQWFLRLEGKSSQEQISSTSRNILRACNQWTI